MELCLGGVCQSNLATCHAKPKAKGEDGFVFVRVWLILRTTLVLVGVAGKPKGTIIVRGVFQQLSAMGSLPR